MESSHDALGLRAPLSEGSCISPSLVRRRGTDSSIRDSRDPPEEEEREAEATAESEKPPFHLTEFREILQVLDDFREIRQLMELLRPRFHRQAAVAMGNQQGVKTKPWCRGLGFNHSRSKFQVPQKRRKARLPPNSSPFGAQASRVICTSVSRKRRTIRGPPALQPSRKSRTDSPNKKDLSFRSSPSIILESPPDSDTDLSECDNEKCSPDNLVNGRSSKDAARRAPPAKEIHPRGDGDDAETAGEVERGFLRTNEEMGDEAAAQRLMGKMEPLEGFIHQPRLRSDWMDEYGDSRDEADFILGRGAQQVALKDREAFPQDLRCRVDKRHLIEEFQVLGEALSQSLRQVLKMEAERGPPTPTEGITPKTNHSESTEKPLTPPLDFSSGGELFSESISPLLSPLLTSSPCPLSLTKVLEKSTSEGHKPPADSDGDISSSQHTRRQRRTLTVLEHGQKKVSQENLEHSEQDQTGENGDLLCSGSDADLGSSAHEL